MGIKAFMLIVSIILIITIVKGRLNDLMLYIIRFALGGILLIFLSKLDFLGFKGKLDILSVFFIISLYLAINISSIFIYFFKQSKRKKYFFLFPIILFLVAGFVLICLIDPNKYLEYKFGILLRVFLSFFPIYSYYYYIKFLKK